MNWLERACREIRETRQTPTANTAERNLTAVMAVSDPVICADYQTCAHNLEEQTSQRAHREIQKSMQTPTANTAERNPTAVLAVPDTALRADSWAFADKLEEWTAEDWHKFFEERAGIAEFDGGLPRAQAEAGAFACCITEWLNRNFVRSPPGRCLACAAGDNGHDPLLPFGIGPTGHAWLHSRCWPVWRTARKAEAVTVLAAMGIATPAEFPDDSKKSGPMKSPETTLRKRASRA